MGNICRSPTAEGVFRNLVALQGLSDHIETDSAGTHAFHVGEPPDRRAQATAQKRGLSISDLRARSVDAADYSEFDYILAMDKDNHGMMLQDCPQEHQSKLHLFLSFAPQLGFSEVPDPYYGGNQGFEKVFDMVQAAAEGLIADIKENRLK